MRGRQADEKRPREHASSETNLMSAILRSRYDFVLARIYERCCINCVISFSKSNLYGIGMKYSGVNLSVVSYYTFDDVSKASCFNFASISVADFFMNERVREVYDENSTSSENLGIILAFY